MKAKFYIDQEIRRLTIKDNTSFVELLKIIQDFWLSQYPNDTNSNLNYKYLDRDGDWVLFSTADEWKDALTNIKDELKITIERKEGEQKKQESKNQQESKTESTQNPFQQFQNQQGNGFGFLQQFLTPENIQKAQQFMTPENMQQAQNMFSQFTQGQNMNDFMKMFQPPQQQGTTNSFPFCKNVQKNLSDEEIKNLNSQLVSMGFYDSSMNETLLKKYEGNIEKVINHLVSL